MNRRDALALFSTVPVAGQDITPTAAEQVADSSWPLLFARANTLPIK